MGRVRSLTDDKGVISLVWGICFWNGKFALWSGAIIIGVDFSF